MNTGVNYYRCQNGRIKMVSKSDEYNSVKGSCDEEDQLLINAQNIAVNEMLICSNDYYLFGEIPAGSAAIMIISQRNVRIIIK